MNTMIGPPLPQSLLSQLDSETARQARLLNTLLTLLIAITLLVYVNVFFSENPAIDALTATLLLVFELAARWLLLRGRVRLSAGVLTSGLWLVLVAATFVNQFEGNGPLVGLALVVIVAGLLLGSAAGFLMAFLNTAAGAVYLALSQSPSPLLPVMVPYSPVGFMVTMGIVFFATAGLIHLASNSLNQAVQLARQSEQATAESNRELEKMRASLEDQVSERTRILEQRTRYLQTAIEIGRATTSILDTQSLLQTAVDLIRDQFGLYYVGLFELEPSGEWALLKAGTGEAGKAMLARGHRIRYGRGMIGWSIANAQPRLAGDVQDDAVRLPTPELPETRSEAAIPLRSRGRVLGALTVQSDKPGAFGEMEISTFQALADQLAIALDNAYLIQQSQQAVEEVQRAYGRISRRAWQEFLDSLEKQKLTYRYGLGTGAPSDELQSVRRRVLETGQPLQTMAHNRPILLLPIKVRDQVIGVINLAKEPAALTPSAPSNGRHPGGRRPADRPAAWSSEEIELLEAIVEQLGVALDSARLYAETRQRAEQERLVDRVTGQMRATLDIDTVLETAARELRDALGLIEVEVRLGYGAQEDER